MGEPFKTGDKVRYVFTGEPLTVIGINQEPGRKIDSYTVTGPKGTFRATDMELIRPGKQENRR